MPTRDRAKILARTLAGWATQEGDLAPWELIVVDDGSTDSTQLLLTSSVVSAGCTFVPVNGLGRGPASARNLGIRLASSPILLFVNDDILPDSTLAARHLTWHELHTDARDALLGAIDRPTDRVTSPFVAWYHRRRQFDFSSIRGNQAQPSRAFFTANVSVKRSMLVDAGDYFDEEFRWAAFEDLELGTRLERRGLRLSFDPLALGHHDHPVNVTAALRHMATCGRCSELFALKALRHRPLTSWRRLELLARCMVTAVTFWPARWLAALVQDHYEVSRVFELAMQSGVHVGLAQQHVSEFLRLALRSRRA